MLRQFCFVLLAALLVSTPKSHATEPTADNLPNFEASRADEIADHQFLVVTGQIDMREEIHRITNKRV